MPIEKRYAAHTAYLHLKFYIHFCLFLDRELVFADGAQRALEIIGKLFPLCAGSYSVIGIAQIFIVYISANITYIFHIVLLYGVTAPALRRSFIQYILFSFSSHQWKPLKCVFGTL